MPNPECRMPRPTNSSQLHRADSTQQTPAQSTSRAHTSLNLHPTTTFVRSIHALGPFSTCITPHILRKCALVARHESPSSSVRLKRRQLGCRVEGDKAPSAPDDRANTDLVTTEPATSGLGIVMHAPACMTLRRESQPLNHLSWTMPRCRAQARQAQARQFRCASRLHALRKQSVPIIPRTRKLKAGPISQRAPKPPQRPRHRLAFTALPQCPMPNA
jgi:hypothetical protein